MLRAASPFDPLTLASPPSSPPLPTPASTDPALPSVPLHPALHPHTRLPVFDLESSSPLSFTAVEKTALKVQLDRAKGTKVLLRQGRPARLLTVQERARLESDEAKESEWSTASGSTRVGGQEAGDEEASSWATDDERDDAVGALSLTDTSAAKAAAASRTARRGSKASARQSGHRLSSPPTLQSTLRTASTAPSAAPASSTTAVPSGAKTAPPSVASSPTSRLGLLLSRHEPRPVSTSPADPHALPSTRQSNAPSMTWNHQPLAVAFAAKKTVSTSSTPPANAPRAASGRPLAMQRGESALGKCRSFPAAPPPTPATSVNSSSFRLPESPPRPVIPRLPPASSFPLASPSRFLSASRLSSPNVSPPLPPLRTSPIMSAKNLDGLTLQFARRPDMPRKGSMGESWSRMQAERERAKVLSGLRRKLSGTSDSRRKYCQDRGRGDEADVEVTDTEVEELDDEALTPHSLEPSVFASPRSNSATTLSASTFSSPPSPTTPCRPITGSASVSSIHSSTRPTSAALSTALSLPVLPVPPPSPPTLPTLHRRATTEPPPSRRPAPAHQAPKHVDLRQLRQEQHARRLQMQAEADDEDESSSSSSSSSSAQSSGPPATLPASPPSVVADAASQPASPPPRPTTAPPRWARAIAGSGAASSVVTSKTAQVAFTVTAAPVAVDGPNTGSGLRRMLFRS
ncbi:hypothetical protein JCM10207_004754 [Rhodosporidiobolus poonsookiae]